MREGSRAIPHRYSTVTPATRIFRLATAGGGYLPAGFTLPDPGWLAPTQEDKSAAAESGRRPGLSGWAQPLTLPAEARAIRGCAPSPDAFPAFEASAESICAKAQTVGERHAHDFDLEIVHDPDPVHQPKPGWEGHSLVEGLSRPGGKSQKPSYQALRTALVSVFERRHD